MKTKPSEANPQGITGLVFIMDNHRGDATPFDHAGFAQMSRRLLGMPTGDTPPPTPDAEPSTSETEPEGKPCVSGVIDGQTFLNER